MSEQIEEKLLRVVLTAEGVQDIETLESLAGYISAFAEDLKDGEYKIGDEIDREGEWGGIRGWVELVANNSSADDWQNGDPHAMRATITRQAAEIERLRDALKQIDALSMVESKNWNKHREIAHAALSSTITGESKE